MEMGAFCKVATFCSAALLASIFSHRLHWQQIRTSSIVAGGRFAIFSWAQVTVLRIVAAMAIRRKAGVLQANTYQHIRQVNNSMGVVVAQNLLPNGKTPLLQLTLSLIVNVHFVVDYISNT